MTSATTTPEIGRAAAAAIKNAYCPYSRFPVGAAVQTASGKIYAASNIENASYSVTLCAERNAAAHAIAAGDRDIVAIALYTPTSSPATPCGMCRQFLSEFNPAMEVLCFCDASPPLRFTLNELLPAAFVLKQRDEAAS